MKETKTPRESLESLIGETNWNFTLRYCDYNSNFTYAHDYPIILETNSAEEVIEYIETNYPEAKSLEGFTDFRSEYVSRKLPYLYLVETPSGRHSFLTEFSTQSL